MPGAIGVRRRRALTDSRGRMSNALAGNVDRRRSHLQAAGFLDRVASCTGF